MKEKTNPIRRLVSHAVFNKLNNPHIAPRKTRFMPKTATLNATLTDGDLATCAAMGIDTDHFLSEKKKHLNGMYSLSATDREIAKNMGVSEDEFLKTKTSATSSAPRVGLSVASHEITDADRKVMKAMGIAPDEFAKQKAKLAGVHS